MHELIIIGAGPAGIGCAIEAKRNNIESVLIDKGNIVDAIIRYPVNMTFFSTSDVMEIAGMPLSSQQIRPSRIEAVRYYQGLIRAFNLNVKINTNIKEIKRKTNSFQLISDNEKLETRRVIIATGYFDNPNMLEIPGENLPHVSHYYTEPYKFYKSRVVVVGAKNSAVETALDLCRHGAEVSMVVRKPEIKESVKYWVLPDILNRIREKKINIFFNSHITKITPAMVEIDAKGKKQNLKADAVFLMTGYHPDTTLMNSAGISFNESTIEPEYDLKSLESSVKDIYLAGSIIAGKNPNKIFIENSRSHGEKIIQDILKKMQDNQNIIQ